MWRHVFVARSRKLSRCGTHPSHASARRRAPTRARACRGGGAMPLSQEDIASIETVAHYTHDDDQAYLMLYGPRRATRCPCLHQRARPPLRAPAPTLAAFDYALNRRRSAPRRRGRVRHHPDRGGLHCRRHEGVDQGAVVPQRTPAFAARSRRASARSAIATTTQFHKGKDPSEYDLVGPKGVWKMGAGSEVLKDDQLIADMMGPKFENKWCVRQRHPVRCVLTRASPSAG